MATYSIVGIEALPKPLHRRWELSMVGTTCFRARQDGETNEVLIHRERQSPSTLLLLRKNGEKVQLESSLDEC